MIKRFLLSNLLSGLTVRCEKVRKYGAFPHLTDHPLTSILHSQHGTEDVTELHMAASLLQYFCTCNDRISDGLNFIHTSVDTKIAAGFSRRYSAIWGKDNTMIWWWIDHIKEKAPGNHKLSLYSRLNKGTNTIIDVLIKISESMTCKSKDIMETIKNWCIYKTIAK